MTSVYEKNQVANTDSKDSGTIQVTAAILVSNDKVLIAKRRIDDRQAGKWEFPGGKIEDGESPEQCLAREMKEELNIEVTVGEYLWESRHRYKRRIISLMAYRTYWKAGTISPNAHEEARWVPMHQLDRYDFAPADQAFVEKLLKGELGPQSHHQ